MLRVFHARFFLALALVLGVLTPITLQIADPPEAEAIQATGGNARFQAISWFSWGAAQATIPNGASLVPRPIRSPASNWRSLAH
ncbi:MAG: hypothetical protein HZY75_12750 [Nocardioidaceae bacterium]|nr:MAG: hypothetical protein HZY75_12750 [Nocardioidaceae bacterium]